MFKNLDSMKFEKDSMKIQRVKTKNFFITCSHFSPVLIIEKFKEKCIEFFAAILNYVFLIFVYFRMFENVVP